MSLLITLLTGSRPHYLERTLASLVEHQSDLLKDARIIAMHNGGDDATHAVLAKYREIIEAVATTQALLPIGAAVSNLFAGVATYDAEYILHLEDDWTAGPGEWLEDAIKLLGISFQVRLRLASAKVLPKHMVTGKAIRWARGRGGTYWPTADAHYTLNPSLMRLADIKAGFPARDERHAQAKFHEAGYRKVVQLVPGIFTHIGEQSLRKRQGR